MNEEVILLGEKVWLHRKQFGFLKQLPKELQKEVAELSNQGVSAVTLSKGLGIDRKTVVAWSLKYQVKKAEPEITNNDFSEVEVVHEKKNNYEVKLKSIIQGCVVELTGSDFSLLQRLMRKLGV